MNIGLVDREKIDRSIRDKYAKAAVSPEGLFKYPVGRAGLEGLGYDPALLARLPDAVAASFCGVGNPFAMGPARPGERVLDVGCGAGVDAILAAFMAGPDGAATGVDASPDMLAKARENAALAKVANVSFLAGKAASLPVPDGAFDLAVSSGALNLVVDKELALAEIFRALAPGGRLQIADQVLTGAPPATVDEAVKSWFR